MQNNMLPCWFGLFSCLAFVPLQSALAQETNSDWNRFRGPNGNGVSIDSNIPAAFGPDKNVIWKTDLSKGYSSPVFQGGKIFLTTEEDKKLFTICLDQVTGHEVWRQEAPRDRTEKLDFRNHPASASPVVDGDDVFVFFPDYGVIAYQVDGTEKWRRPLGPFTNLYGMGASPIVVDGLVILVCDQNVESFIIALNKNTGDVAWKTKREEATSGHCSPVIYRPNADKPAQIIVAGSFNLTSYDSTTGDKLWWVGGLCFEMKSTPVLSNDTAFINGFGSPQNEVDKSFDVAEFDVVVAEKDEDGDGVLSVSEMPDDLARNFFPAVDLDANKSLNENEWRYYRASIASKNSMMAIRLGGSGDMTNQNTLWKYHKNIPQLPSPLLVGDQLLMVSERGILTSLNPSTGEVQFKGRIPGVVGSYYASPVGAGDKVIFATISGKVAVVKAGGMKDGDELNVLSVNDLGEGIFATPAVVDDRLYVRTDKTLFCFGIADAKSDEQKSN